VRLSCRQAVVDVTTDSFVHRGEQHGRPGSSGLLLAQRHFRKHATEQPVLLVVSDGEPTSHLEPDGEVYFDYPPHPLTLVHTTRELDNVGRFGAQVTFFRLGEDPGLARFVDAMARRVGGRVVAPELEDLAVAVVDSYLGSRGPPDRKWFGGRGWWANP